MMYTFSVETMSQTPAVALRVKERGLLGGRFGDFLLFFMQLRVDDN
jgi:hypothetical protein